MDADLTVADPGLHAVGDRGGVHEGGHLTHQVGLLHVLKQRQLVRADLYACASRHAGTSSAARRTSRAWSPSSGSCSRSQPWRGTDGSTTGRWSTGPS